MFVQLLLSGLVIGGIYGLIALGYSLIYKASGLMSFAQGDLLTLGAFLGLTFYQILGLPFAVSLILTLIIAFLLGMSIERVIIRVLLSKNVMPIYIVLATIAVSYLLQNGAMLTWGSNTQYFPSIFKNIASITILGRKVQVEYAFCIILACLCQSRLDKALHLGATHVINAAKEDVLAQIEKYTDGSGADVVFETAGSKYTANQTSHAVAKGGRVVMVGIVLGDIPYNFRPLNRKEADLKTVWRYCNAYPYALTAVENGYINLDGIITNIFDFRDAQKAFETAITDKENVIKIALKFSDN